MVKQKSIVETFYKNVWKRDGTVSTTRVNVAKVPDSTPQSTGTIVSLEGVGEACLLSERRVSQPEAGYRYHDFYLR